MNRRPLFFIILIAVMLGGCVPYPGVYHTVGSGETFWRICKTYGADPQEVAELNDIEDPKVIMAGSKIFIPGADRRLKVYPPGSPNAFDGADKDVKKTAKSTKKRKVRINKSKAQSKKVIVASVDDGANNHAEEKLSFDKSKFIWPVKGFIESRFGMRSSGRHDGIDIKAPEGTPVKAAADGVVVYSDSNMRGYGNVVIVRHKDDFYTVYAHNSKNKVSDGDRISKGDIIALVGRTGNATNDHLHFEVREGKKVRNPLFFLP